MSRMLYSNMLIDFFIKNQFIMNNINVNSYVSRNDQVRIEDKKVGKKDNQVFTNSWSCVSGNFYFVPTVPMF